MLETLFGRSAIAVGVVLIAFAVGHLTGRALESGLRRADLSPTQRTFFSRLVMWLVVLIGATLALDVLGLERVVTRLLAGSGIVAIVFGFAFREIGENLLAGLFLTFSRPFEAGDWIASESFEGEVKEIELRYTHIRTADAIDVYLPNAQLFNRPLSNYTRDGLRRIQFVVGIDYANDAEGACALLQQSVSSVAGILPSPAPRARIAALAENYVEIEVAIWLNTELAATNGDAGVTAHDEYLRNVRSAAMDSCRIALNEHGFTVSANVSANVVLEGEIAQKT